MYYSLTSSRRRSTEQTAGISNQRFITSVCLISKVLTPWLSVTIRTRRFGVVPVKLTLGAAIISNLKIEL